MATCPTQTGGLGSFSFLISLVILDFETAFVDFVRDVYIPDLPLDFSLKTWEMTEEFKNLDIQEAELIEHLKQLCEGTSLEPKTFFPYAYDLILDRAKGPKLSTLITTMGAERALPLLRGGLGRLA